MNLMDARKMGEALIEEFLPGRGWRLTFDNAKKRLGACKYRTKEISLSAPLVSLNDESVVNETIRHEVAHAIAGHAAGHGPQWRAACRITGSTGARCYDSKTVVAVAAPFELYCPKCGSSSPRHRQTRSVYICRTCRDHTGRSDGRVVLLWRRGGQPRPIAPPRSTTGVTYTPPAPKQPTPAEAVAAVVKRVGAWQL